MINFHNLTNLAYKLEVIKMIEQFEVDKKVGRIDIRLHNDNGWNEEVLLKMIEKYKNVYLIYLGDWNNVVDNRMHGLVQ